LDDQLNVQDKGFHLSKVFFLEADDHLLFIFLSCWCQLLVSSVTNRVIIVKNANNVFEKVCCLYLLRYKVKILNCMWVQDCLKVSFKLIKNRLIKVSHVTELLNYAFICQQVCWNMKVTFVCLVIQMFTLSVESCGIKTPSQYIYDRDLNCIHFASLLDSWHLKGWKQTGWISVNLVCLDEAMHGTSLNWQFKHVLKLIWSVYKQIMHTWGINTLL